MTPTTFSLEYTQRRVSLQVNSDGTFSVKLSILPGHDEMWVTLYYERDVTEAQGERLAERVRDAKQIDLARWTWGAHGLSCPWATFQVNSKSFFAARAEAA